MEPWLEFAVLIFTGIGVAALNAVAGGGAFFSFPILVFLGLNPIAANATGKFAIWIGAVSSIGGYWNEIKAQRKNLPYVTIFASLGSIAGSLLLLVTPAEAFRAMVPWLMLIATLIFAFGKMLTELLARFVSAESSKGIWAMILPAIGITIIGTYGGFFGAGMGIMLVAFCQLVGIHNVHESNAIKVVVATGITTLSAAIFIISGVIEWQQAIPLAMGTVIGGYFGASFARRLPQQVIRIFIIFYGISVSAFFFLQP